MGEVKRRGRKGKGEVKSGGGVTGVFVDDKYYSLMGSRGELVLIHKSNCLKWCNISTELRVIRTNVHRVETGFNL